MLKQLGFYSLVLSGLALLVVFVEGSLQPNVFAHPKWLISSLVSLALGIVVGVKWKDKTLHSFKRQWIWQQLSKREKEVAKLVLDHKSNKEICEQLYIEPNTLKTHIRNIYKKSHCANRNAFIQLYRK